jgi:SAM-dependent methyltransferase
MKKHHHDVLGLALKDYLISHQESHIIVHSPDFEDDIIPVSYYFRSEDRWPEIEKTAMEYCHGHVLDAGAGAGSHALYLQEKGFDVTALDISGGACDIMKKRGLQSVVRGDIFSFESNSFDTILMLMNGIGLVQSIRGLRRFLKRIPKIVKPGGQVVFDSTNLVYLLQQDDGSVLLNINDVYYGEIEFQLEYAGYISEAFNWLYIDFDTLDWLAEEAGLSTDLIMEGENMSYLARIMV